MKKKTLRSAALLCVAGTALAGCTTGTTSGGSEGGGEDTLVIASWGGSFTEATQKYLADPFSEETGIDVQIVDSPGNQVAQLEAMQSTGNIQWDILDAANGMATYTLAERDLIADLDEETRQGFIDVMGEDNVTDFGFTFGSLGFVLVCNTETVEKCPTKVSEFFDDEAFPGQRVMLGEKESQTITLAALALTDDPSKVHPIDIDAAIEELRGVRDSVRVWPTSSQAAEDAFVQGEVDMGILQSGRAYNLLDGMDGIEITWEGVYDPGFTFAVEGAPHPEAAKRYLQWIADNPEAQAEWATAMRYGVPGTEAGEFLDPQVAERLAENPENFSKLAQQDFTWYLENRPEIDESVRAVIQGQ